VKLFSINDCVGLECLEVFYITYEENIAGLILTAIGPERPIESE